MTKPSQTAPEPTNIQIGSPQHACPNCGYCPHCGRSNLAPRSPFYPWYGVIPPYPNPYSYPTTTWQGTSTVGFGANATGGYGYSI